MKRTALAALAVACVLSVACVTSAAALPLGLRLAARAAAATQRAETPEERAFRIYAPCSAFEVAVTNGATVAFAITLLSGHASATVDWGDGTSSTHTSSPASHAYAADGSFVVKISDDISTFRVYDYAASRPFVTAALRWGDSVTSAATTYRECSNLTGFVPRWPDTLTSASYTYYNCTGLTGAPADWSGCTALTDVSYTYRGCTKLVGEIKAWPPNAKNTDCSYALCSGLYGDVPAWPDSVTAAFDTFWNTKVSGNIKPWPPAMFSARYTYESCKYLTGAWTDDPDELMPNIRYHDHCVTDASAALRALFYSDWGGTRTKEE